MSDDIKDQTSVELQQSRADLSSKIERCNENVGRLSAEMSAMQVEVQKLVSRASAIDTELERRTRPAPEVRLSEHALLRFIERICDIDVEEIRARILSPAVVAAVQAGASAVTIENVKFIVKGNTIITTFGEQQRVKKRDHKRVRVVDPIEAGLQEYFEDREAAF